MLAQSYCARFKHLLPALCEAVAASGSTPSLTEQEIAKWENTIAHWRSAIIGIAAEPLKSSVPELDHAMNQLTMAVQARESSRFAAYHVHAVEYQQSLEKKVVELEARASSGSTGAPDDQPTPQPDWRKNPEVMAVHRRLIHELAEMTMKPSVEQRHKVGRVIDAFGDAVSSRGDDVREPTRPDAYAIVNKNGVVTDAEPSPCRADNRRNALEQQVEFYSGPYEVQPLYLGSAQLDQQGAGSTGGAPTRAAHDL